MKITILAVGSRGDVQPYIALGLGLKSAGHSVKLVAPTNFESLVAGYGLDYAPLRADYYALMDSPEGRDLKSGNPIRIMQNMKQIVYPLMRRMIDDAWEGARDAEALVFHPKIMIGTHIAEKLNIPIYAAMAVPVMTPTKAFAAPGVVNRNLGGTLNKLTYSAMDMAVKPFNGIIGEWREKSLGLPAKSNVVQGFKLHGKPVPTLYAYSQHVLPRPADWPENAHITGYWFLDAAPDWQPSRDLLEFLEDGPAPVYVGFGSMVSENAEQVTRNVVSALLKANQRGVIASGWGGLREIDLPPTIYRLSEAPHDWLFPRMAAVVHHGGAGTTGAGLRAGKPTLIVPHMVDQPFWGKVVHELGVGPQAIPVKKLTADNLGDAIYTAATDESMRRKADEIGKRIRSEDGIANAVQIIGQAEKVPV
ncbi:MAG: glycosyltransferase [Anaerolineae bacterium]|nr:glycosyltransferase [Anaerolineae bacterium]